MRSFICCQVLSSLIPISNIENREKLRGKLEQSGGLHYDLDPGEMSMFVKRGRSEPTSGQKGNSGNSSVKKNKKETATPVPTPALESESRSVEDAEPVVTEKKRRRSKKNRHEDQVDDEKQIESDEKHEKSVRGARSSEGSLMKRRRKVELQISVTPAGITQNQQTNMGPPEDTPGNKNRYKRIPSAGNLACLLESPLSLDKHVVFDVGYPITSDTPTLSKLMNLIPPMSKSGIGSDLKFDFDEVVQHFHSPRTQLEVSSRWGTGTSSGNAANLDSTTSVGSVDSIFNFSSEGPLSKSSLEAVHAMYKDGYGLGSNGKHDIDSHVLFSHFANTPIGRTLGRIDGQSSGSAPASSGSAQKLVNFFFSMRTIIILMNIILCRVSK